MKGGETSKIFAREIMKKIEQIMSKNVITIDIDTNFNEIIKIMKDNNIGEIPVLENGNVVGVITRDDILIKEGNIKSPQIIAFWDMVIMLPSHKDYETNLKKMFAYKAKDIMNKKFYSIEISSCIKDVITNIVEYKHEFVIVMDNKKLVGIITKKDIINNYF